MSKSKAPIQKVIHNIVKKSPSMSKQSKKIVKKSHQKFPPRSPTCPKNIKNFKMLVEMTKILIQFPDLTSLEIKKLCDKCWLEVLFEKIF